MEEQGLDPHAVFSLPIEESLAAANDSGVPLVCADQEGMHREDQKQAAAVPIFRGACRVYFGWPHAAAQRVCSRLDVFGHGVQVAG